jgi:hypothetical protein
MRSIRGGETVTNSLARLKLLSTFCPHLRDASMPMETRQMALPHRFRGHPRSLPQETRLHQRSPTPCSMAAVVTREARLDLEPPVFYISHLHRRSFALDTTRRSTSSLFCTSVPRLLYFSLCIERPTSVITLAQFQHNRQHHSFGSKVRQTLHPLALPGKLLSCLSLLFCLFLLGPRLLLLA